MDIKNTLFQSLLRQQKIQDFLPMHIDSSSIGNAKLGNEIKVDSKYVDLESLYGYVKDAIFHICDEHFEEIQLCHFHFKEKGLHLIGITEEAYCYPCSDCKKSIVAIIESSKNKCSSNSSSISS